MTDLMAKQCHIDISEDDILEAMKAVRGFLDITPSDFREIYRIAYRQAIERLSRSVTAADIMTRSVIAVDQAAPLPEVAGIMANHGISGVPVTSGGRRTVVGVVSEKDFMRAMAGDRHQSIMHVIETCLSRSGCAVKPLRNRRAADIMTTPAVTVGAGATFSKLARLFDSRQINRVPVVDEQNLLIGIVARSDMVGAWCRVCHELP